ncbi:fumarate reductase (quinol) flavoprotein subunit [Motilimonas sp. 1_MG-2023]|uniref:fumarate reductase (quinol) flavoprotein subunit n=1 Tax=unclassified Motilimonas TaxID=2643697 RepID=UPI001E62FC07|nr:fumarate reductase (quinol) flavoprotein subunit [Motilimonas sp. 1_MG-2023]MCE0557053.1 fumarate reductase (quinol) flavoprotein subunit [Motilimonas sp. E26]MDO6524287.1 fumarate reductase (quinol) flavoprotein subunit [Motilimonas sp. 1_MG-2023]
MEIIKTDVAIIGAGGGGLRAAIAAAEANPELEIALISKVYPMRSHTVAAEGGAAGVVQEHDSLDNHFNDTVSGGDWLCDQDTVEYFVENATRQLTQLEHWGCPWSRKEDGKINVRAFGGMKIERTWFAADKSGFHMLHTLFQTSIKYPSIKRFDEHFCLDLLVFDGKVQGAVLLDIAEGITRVIHAKTVIVATGGAGRVYTYNTNGGIVTGDGMSMCYRHGVPLRDMEFVQYHPTGLPGSGILMTEGCRGEGGILVNKDGYRYLQDYGLGPEIPVGKTKNKHMELGPRDRLSQCFWQEQQQGRVISTKRGDVVHLDLRHLGEEKINERLPFIRELAKAYVGVDPVHEPIPVRPTVHYTMGGIETDAKTATRLPGLYAVGECASSGLHGANRLGSNSLTELVVFGEVAGQQAAKFAQENKHSAIAKVRDAAKAVIDKAEALLHSEGTESIANIRREMGDCMEAGVGIYRTETSMQQAIDKLAELKQRYKNIKISDKSSVFNTELLYAIELGYLLDTAEAMAHSAILRKESRGSHQRIDGYEKRDDENYLTHSLAFYNPDKAPTIDYASVTITKSQPAERVYGAASDAQDAAKAAEVKHD